MFCNDIVKNNTHKRGQSSKHNRPLGVLLSLSVGGILFCLTVHVCADWTDPLECD